MFSAPKSAPRLAPPPKQGARTGEFELAFRSQCRMTEFSPLAFQFRRVMTFWLLLPLRATLTSAWQLALTSISSTHQRNWRGSSPARTSYKGLEQAGYEKFFELLFSPRLRFVVILSPFAVVDPTSFCSPLPTSDPFNWCFSLACTTASNSSRSPLPNHHPLFHLLLIYRIF